MRRLLLATESVAEKQRKCCQTRFNDECLIHCQWCSGASFTLTVGDVLVLSITFIDLFSVITVCNEPYCRLVSSNKIWRRIATTLRSWRRCSQVATTTFTKWREMSSKERYSSLQASLPSPLRELTCHGITQCYLPPGRGDIPTFTPAEAGTRFSDPGGMQGWVDLGGWLEMVYPHNGHPSWTNRARCWLTSLMRPTTLTTTTSRHPICNLILAELVMVANICQTSMLEYQWCFDNRAEPITTWR